MIITKIICLLQLQSDKPSHHQLQRVHEDSSVCNFVAVGFSDVEQGFIKIDLSMAKKLR